MATGDVRVNGSARLYGLLLLLYPRSFRLTFGSDMAQVFRESYRHEAEDARLGTALLFWLGVVKDLAASTLAEWGQALLQPGEVKQLVRRVADGLTVPLVVSGSLLGAGYLGGTLAHKATVSATIPAGSGFATPPFTVVTSVAVAMGLGILGLLVAFLRARNRQTGSPWIRVQPSGTRNNRSFNRA
jgi:hypothetical protein